MAIPGSPVSEAMALVQGVLTVAASPGGQAALMKLFEDHGVPQPRLDFIIANLPTAQPPKE